MGVNAASEKSCPSQPNYRALAGYGLQSTGNWTLATPALDWRSHFRKLCYRSPRRGFPVRSMERKPTCRHGAEDLRRFHGTNLVWVQYVGLSCAEDPTVFAWDAKQGRVLITLDVATVTRYASERLDAGLPPPGVVEIVASTRLVKS
jgi:hypothetical protein